MPHAAHCDAHPGMQRCLPSGLFPSHTRPSFHYHPSLIRSQQVQGGSRASEQRPGCAHLHAAVPAPAARMRPDAGARVSAAPAPVLRLNGIGPLTLTNLDHLVATRVALCQKKRLRFTASLPLIRVLQLVSFSTLPCLFFGSRMPTWPSALASACPLLSFRVSDVSIARRACRVS